MAPMYTHICRKTKKWLLWQRRIFARYRKHDRKYLHFVSRPLESPFITNCLSLIAIIHMKPVSPYIAVSAQKLVAIANATSLSTCGPHLTHDSFLGPIRAHNPNDISTGSAVFPQMTVECPYSLQWHAPFPPSFCMAQCHRQTDRPRQSVGNNRPHLRM